MVKCPVCRKEPQDNNCGLLVFLQAECPVCFNETKPLVALPCGHAMCKEDFRKIGGVLEEDTNERAQRQDQPEASSPETRREGEDPQPTRYPSVQTQQTRSAPRVVAPSPPANSRSSGRSARQNRSPQRKPSVWVHCPTDAARNRNDWRLWHVMDHSEREMFQYPMDTKIVGDGKDGVWALCRTDNKWRLWQAKANKQERDRYEFPQESHLAGDGEGGVWVLCPTIGYNAGQQWRLWHVTKSRERDMYGYPSNSTLIGDGCGGVWVHCRTNGEWRLWHANVQRESDMFQYPENTKFASDGIGGVWALCFTDGIWRLWHADRNKRERNLYAFPQDSQLVGDNKGGVWVLCSTSGYREGNKWRLWHVNEDRELNLYGYPANSKLSGDGCGGVWVLCLTDGDWRLWHANERDEHNMFAFPGGSHVIAPT